MASVPPVEKDGFSYAVDSLYREASNHRHRRATIPELKAHFSGKDTENRPAHWYEAQLLHYGLPPSKVKGTAHKRLFDAVTGKGGLAVPEHIKKIEADLKKEWKKTEREAKKIMKAPSGADAAKPTKGTKRKAEQVSTNVSVNVSVQVSRTGAVKVDTAQPAAKRAKASRPSSSSTTTKKTTAVASKAKKTTTSTKSQKATPGGKTAPPPKPAKPATKARTPAKSTTQRPAAPETNSTQVPSVAPRSSQGGYDNDQGVYDEGGYDDNGYGSYTEQPQNEDYEPHSSPRRSLGILNGRYKVSCPLLEENFPEYMKDCGLIATLDGYSLWLKFDFGPATGLIKVERPYEASEDALTAVWRGFAPDRDNNRRFFNIDTMYRAGPVNWLRFLGSGHIEGMITYDDIEVRFDAYRLPGQSMTSEVSPSEARAEWAQLEQNMDTYW
ncbi:hypothetical protein SLS53_002360 [Cytospora paraplurivora]|uniref:Uncharacterized protein n=1 Tax=Cytospora paraplurivora TaxID=2898453 RepID=A0AAN9UG98_9PEZI